jgi:ABC-type transport system substrate-binding protein
VEISGRELPAGQIRVKLRDSGSGYSDDIEISTQGLPRLFTRFRATALAEGRRVADRPAEPSHYLAVYACGRDHNSALFLKLRFGSRLRGAETIVADKAWFGWPKDDRIEALRKQWLLASDSEARQEIAAKIQQHAFEVVPYIPTGQYSPKTAYRKNLNGIIIAPALFM